MSNSSAYLGAFADPTKITVTFDRAILEDCFQALNFDDSITVTDEQWKQVFDAVYESTAVGEFVHSVVEIAEATLIQE